MLIHQPAARKHHKTTSPGATRVRSSQSPLGLAQIDTRPCSLCTSRTNAAVGGNPFATQRWRFRRVFLGFITRGGTNNSTLRDVTLGATTNAGPMLEIHSVLFAVMKHETVLCNFACFMGQNNRAEDGSSKRLLMSRRKQRDIGQSSMSFLHVPIVC